MSIERHSRSQQTFLEEFDSWLVAFGEAGRKDKPCGATVIEKIQETPEGRRTLEDEGSGLAGD
jgi:hypothetical protein